MGAPKDPAMLLSFVNMKLRDFYKSLDELCDREELDRAEVECILKKIDYSYNEKNNRFE